MLRIGTAGWSIPRTVAALFPTQGTHLERYARVLPCAEINSSFYRPPMPSTCKKWAAAAPSGFQFSVKAPKAITHEGKLATPPSILQDFLAAATLLGAKLGPILFQLPPKLAFDPEVAPTFLATLRAHFSGPAAFEPRHASWFTPQVSELLAAHRIARVAADPAKVPEAAQPGGWPGLLYYRLHGSPRIYYSSYAPEYLEALSRAIAKSPEAWVIFDNTASGAALHNALELSDLLPACSRDKRTRTS